MISPASWQSFFQERLKKSCRPTKKQKSQSRTAPKEERKREDVWARKPPTRPPPERSPRPMFQAALVVRMQSDSSAKPHHRHQVMVKLRERKDAPTPPMAKGRSREAEPKRSLRKPEA